MNYKIWLKTVTFSSIILISIVMLINYIINPFNIFKNDFLIKPYQINERFVKIEYLKENHKKYNSYMMGSSRIGTTNPSTVEKYIPDSKFYNFTVATASQYDNYMHLKYMIENNYKINNLYLQVDIKNFLLDDKPLKSDFLRKTHPSVLNENLFAFYIQNLVILPYKNIKEKLLINILDKKNIVRYDIENTGRWYVDYKDEMIKSNHLAFIKNEETLNINKETRKIKNIHLNENTKNLKKIVALCNKYNINLYVFTTPHNYNMMNNIDLEAYVATLKSISRITDFWDFSGYNSVSCNNRYYYEKSHYTSEVGEIIANKIFNKNSYDDFGIYITFDNINAYINSIENINSCKSSYLKDKLNNALQ